MKTSGPVDWQDHESYLFLNPRLGQTDCQALFSAVENCIEQNPRLAGHVFLATSGSTSGAGAVKLVALSKSAILASAKAVNEVYGLGSSDRWFQVLPEHHIGGLAVFARAFLAKNTVIEFSPKWQAQEFHQKLQEISCTVGSLVPTQIYDLVKNRLRAPSCLRMVFVGGGTLSPELYEQASALGWPLLPTYGCSEAASQVATALPGSPDLRVLPHLQVKIIDGRIAFAGASLFTGYIYFENGQTRFADPRHDGWFVTEDHGELSGDHLQCFGRDFTFAKVNGENVDLSHLETILRSLTDVDFTLIGLPDQRSGQIVALVSPHANKLQAAIEGFNARVLPFERIQKVFPVEIPRSDLGKIRYAQLLQSLSIAR